MIEKINIHLIKKAVDKAMACSSNSLEARDFIVNRSKYEAEILDWIIKGDYPPVIYHHKTIVSRDGKLRKLSMCPLRDRVVMHVILLLIKDKFLGRVSDDAYNCIPNRGINSSYKRGDPNAMIKRCMNEGHWGYLQLDIAKCYESTRADILERELRRFLATDDDQFIRLFITYSMCEIGLPIGTPLSPVNHHIMMFIIDDFIRQDLMIEGYVRYADDMILFGSKEQLHEAAHRIRNKLWYELGYKLKREAHPTPIRVPLDVLGYSYRPGVTLLRKRTKERMKKAWSKPLSRASYMGILTGCDSHNLLNKLNMNFSDIVNNDTRVTRRMDSPLDKIENVEGVFDILDFEVREPDKRNGKYWMRMQIRYKKDGQDVVRLIKGYQPAICQFLLNVDKEMRKRSMLASMPYEEVRRDMMPIVGAELENSNGWIFKGTINTLQ